MIAVMGRQGIPTRTGRTAMAPGVLIGRERELELLTGLIDHYPPLGGVLLLTGDPGIGKSTLLNHAESQARERGYLVLSVVGVEAETAFPFAALHQLL